MNTSVLDAVLINPEALRRNTRSVAAVAISRLLLSLRELDVPNLAVPDPHQRAVEDALAVAGSRIDAHRAADLCRAASLVDVPVQAEHGLVALDQLADRGAAGGGHHRV